MVGRILESKRDVGIGTIEKATEKLRLSADFFFIPGGDALPYRDFLRSKAPDQKLGPVEPHPAVTAYLSTDEGRRLRVFTTDILKSIDFGSLAPTTETLRSITEALERQDMRSGQVRTLKSLPPPKKR